MGFLFWFYEQLKDFFCPKYCVGCGRFGQFLCPDCFNKLEFLFNPLDIKIKDLYVDKFFSLANYAFPLDKLIQQYKYQSVKDMSIFLAQMLFKNLSLPPFDYLTFIPIHQQRFQDRLFNQSKELAFQLSILDCKPMIPFLKKEINTAHQASSKKGSLRFRLQRGSFSLREKFVNSSDFKDKIIVIVDDVLTTGATLNEVAMILKKELKVNKVYGLVVAHNNF